MHLEYELLINPHKLFRAFGDETKLPHQTNNTDNTPLDIKIEVAMNHVLLILGLVLNVSMIIIIASRKSMHKSYSCYILSFVLSNLILLLDPLRNVLLWWLNIDMFLDIQYIIDLTFKASILTLGMLTIDRYTYICSKNNPIHNMILKFETAAKSVLIIWTMTSIITAMELHLYAQFAWDVDYQHNIDPAFQIFVISTFIFLVMPIILIFCLGSLMIYDLEQLRLIGEVSENDVEVLRLLAGVTVGFFMTMVPHRVALTVTYTNPGICCTKNNLEIYFTVAKGATIVFPAICFVTSKQIRKGLKDSICCCGCIFKKNERPEKTTQLNPEGRD